MSSAWKSIIGRGQWGGLQVLEWVYLPSSLPWGVGGQQDWGSPQATLIEDGASSDPPGARQEQKQPHSAARAALAKQPKPRAGDSDAWL